MKSDSFMDIVFTMQKDIIVRYLVLHYCLLFICAIIGVRALSHSSLGISVMMMYFGRIQRMEVIIISIRPNLFPEPKD